MDLADHLRNLPQELFDLVYDMVFTADNGARVRIDNSYKPPCLLAVNRASHERYAKSYFHSSIFVMKINAYSAMWLVSLPMQHHGFLHEIRASWTTAI